MNVLIIGSGGREHALAWKASQSDRVSKLFCAPGNAGTAGLAQNLPVEASDILALAALAEDRHIDLTFVGPEDPLCAGIVDLFTARGLRIFGPTAAAAKLEGDKAHAKRLMRQAAIPMAEGRIFESYERARDYVATRDSALVVKAAGLAQGKGVVVCAEPSQALIVLENMMLKKAFGDAGNVVLVDEKLSGPEVSVHALVDGRNIYILESSRDHKPIGDGDTGPNTGGMGAYSPAGVLDDTTLQLVYREVLVPVVDALNRAGCAYRGVLYVGLMLTAAGPKVLEFNCRFGDPEAQVILPRLQSDVIDAADAVINGELEALTLQWDPRPSVCVVLTSEGYPGAYPTGRIVSGLEQAGACADTVVFHAGTSKLKGNVVTSGGRVLGVTALVAHLEEAHDRAYSAVGLISFDGVYCRSDIASAGLNKLKA